MDDNSNLCQYRGEYYNVWVHEMELQVVFTHTRYERYFANAAAATSQNASNLFFPDSYVICECVSQNNSTVDYLKVIKAQDILVGINGEAIACFPKDMPIHEWEKKYNEFSYPRLVCFFHPSEIGSRVFTPAKVAFF